MRRLIARIGSTLWPLVHRRPRDNECTICGKPLRRCPNSDKPGQHEHFYCPCRAEVHETGGCINVWRWARGQNTQQNPEQN
jgi:hypothetical protein